MPELKLPTKPVENWERVRDDWVGAVETLVAEVETWCKAKDWPTRRIEKRLEDSRIGGYAVPALLIQVDLVKLLLEPVARFVPGAEGVIDLYRMPQYDDAASVFLRDGRWEYFATITSDKLPPDQVPPQPDSDVVGTTGPFTSETFSDLVSLLV